MEGFAAEGKAVGVVLDVSRRHDSGVSLLDTIKKSLIETIRKSFAFNHDAFYLFHPDLIQATYKNGEHYCAIGNYRTDGVPFDLQFALKQTLYVLANEDEAFRKYVILITDRIKSVACLEKLVFLNRKERVNAKLVVIAIGDHYDKDGFVLLKEQDVTVFHINQPSEIMDLLLKESANGSQDICGPSNECCQ